MKYLTFYTTFPSKPKAKQVIFKLLEQKLIACANLIPTADSLYFWDQKIVCEKETLVIGKTMMIKKKHLVKKLKEYHPYENPCIVFWSIKGGSRFYLKWMRDVLEV